jgi:NHL repeat-containing protein
MLSHSDRVKFTLLAALVATIAISEVRTHAQPNPYRVVENWTQLPNGLKFGQVMAVYPGPDDSLYVFHRCGSDTCVGRTEPPILKFDRSGKTVKSWGEGMFVWPHGLHVDRDGFVWVTDARGQDGKGQQVIKFSPDGKVLMTLGKAGVAGSGPDTFNGPSDVVVAPNGDIFVADGHQPCEASADCTPRVVKFSKDGKFIKTWGKKGSAPGDLNDPHAIAMDTRGRIFVGDRLNNRIQIFDQEGRLLDQWKQFGTPSGIFISRDDTIYVADPNNPSGKTGFYIGAAKDGSVRFFVPEERLGAERVAADAQGNVYGAEVGPRTVRKFVKK